MSDKGFAIVTGSARGMGKAFAEQTAAEGYDMVINHVTDSSAKAAKAVADGIKEKYGVEAIVVKADVSEYAQAQALVAAGIEAFGPKIAVLVNNAGIDNVTPFFEKTPADIETMIRVDLLSQLYMNHIVIPHMIETGGGHIVNLASVAAVQGGNFMVDYAAAKAGVIGMTKALAGLYAENGILINAIAPGMIDTEMVQTAPAETREYYLSLTPLHTIGSLEEMQSLLHYLITTDFMTGQVVHPNGGLYI